MEPRRRYPWTFWIIAVGLVLATVFAAGSICLILIQPIQPSRERVQDEVRMRMIRGRAALSEGSFQLAADDLRMAEKLLALNPNAASKPLRIELAQLQAQSELLADLLTESLEEILRQIAGLPTKEAQAIVAKNYRGRSVVFLAELRRLASGSYECSYRPSEMNAEAKLALEEVRLLGTLPLDEPSLVLWGARLSGMDRTSQGVWKISFFPDSGVLITNPSAAHACCFSPPDRDELQMTVERQASWIHDWR